MSILRTAFGASMTALFALSMGAAATAQDCMGWLLAATNGPSPRFETALAYDGARSVTVLFGGYDSYPDGETWEWDGRTWMRRATSGPSPRYGHAMAYDILRERVVLFGGVEAYGRPEDTWEWDGTEWLLLATTGPGDVGDSAAMAYDEARGIVVLFHWTSTRGETWGWDGSAWSILATSGPSARSWFAMACDGSRERVVLFGGYGDSSMKGDTWEWDGSAWSLRSSAGPSARIGHAMAYDSARRRVVLFGGYDNDNDGETWEWDGEDWMLRDTTGPESRYLHAMAFDSARGRVVLFGGDDLDWDETWEWSPDCDCDGVPGDNCGCGDVTRLKSTCKSRDGRYKIRASVVAQLPEGTPFTFTLDGEDPHVVALNERGRAKTSWVTLVKGEREVCLDECRDAGLCRHPVCE